MSFPCWGIDRRNGFCVDGGPDLLLAACVGFPLLPVIHHNKRRCHCNCHPSHSITIVATTISIMSTQEQPASKVYSMLPKTIGRLTTQQFDKKSRLKITEDSKAHKAGDAGKVVESFKTGNYYVCLYQSNILKESQQLLEIYISHPIRQQQASIRCPTEHFGRGIACHFVGVL